MKKRVINAVSLFTGAGGLDLGMEAAGFHIALASDIMAESCDTLRLNRPNMNVFGPGSGSSDSGDIADMTAELIYQRTGLKPGEVDIMLGGPPCQSFSMASAQRFLKSDDNFKRKGFDSDKGQLVFQYLRLIQEIKPKVFVIENVPGFATIDNGETIKNIIKVLEGYGYNVSGPNLVKTEEYGIPQLRRRVILVGSLSDIPFVFPAPTHGAKALDVKAPAYTTVAQALASINYSSHNLEVRTHKEESVNRYKALRVGQRDKLGRVDRLNPLAPSKTIIAGGASGGGRSHLHPFEARTLSVRESAKIQTFPDDYRFLGKGGRQFTQVGNAVPVLLGEVIGRAIGEQYFGQTYNKSLHYALTGPEAQDAAAQLLDRSKTEYPEKLYNDIDTTPAIVNSEPDELADINISMQRTLFEA